jgi:hypothetical protein
MPPVESYNLTLIGQFPESLPQFLPPGRVHVERLGDIGQGERLAFSSPDDAEDFFGGKRGDRMFFLG